MTGIAGSPTASRAVRRRGGKQSGVWGATPKVLPRVVDKNTGKGKKVIIAMITGVLWKMGRIVLS